MIEEQAQVVDVSGEQLVLQVQTQSTCGACAANKGCGTSVLSKVVGKKFTQFQARNDVDAEVGDTVVVGISEDALLTGSMMMYVVPIIAMMLFALLSDFALPATVDSRDLSIAAIAILGFIMGSAVSKHYFQRHSNRERFTPVVLRKVANHGKL